ncbi:uncharacterized protein [Manis javanica]|uniref:uncharacterized protein n=1 Tax=Manis javanica TaxID=9974 RepID=UPI003C6CD983
MYKEQQPSKCLSADERKTETTANSKAQLSTVSSSCCGPGLGGTEVVRRRRARGGRVDSCGDSWGCCGNRQVRGSARRHRSTNPGREGGAPPPPPPPRVRTGCEHLPEAPSARGSPSCDNPGRAGTGGPVLSRLAHPHKPSGPSSRTPTAPTGLGAASPPPAAFPPLPRPCLPAAPGSPVRAPAPHRPLRRPPPSSPDTQGSARQSGETRRGRTLRPSKAGSSPQTPPPSRPPPPPTPARPALHAHVCLPERLLAGWARRLPADVLDRGGCRGPAAGALPAPSRSPGNVLAVSGRWRGCPRDPHGHGEQGSPRAVGRPEATGSSRVRTPHAAPCRVATFPHGHLLTRPWTDTSPVA